MISSSLRLLAALILAATACTSSRDSAFAPAPGTAGAVASVTQAAHPADRFLAALAQHCGQAFVGRILTNEPATSTPDAFEGQRLVMHVRGCADPTRELRVPFFVGDDRSRTWVLTRIADGLRLKHDHRHEDGSEDAVTMYGGDTSAPGTALRQEFPVDAESRALFEREGLNASLTNTWALEIEPGRRFLYELRRPGGRLFQVEFDLSSPVPPPAPPWGDELR